MHDGDNESPRHTGSPAWATLDINGQQPPGVTASMTFRAAALLCLCALPALPQARFDVATIKPSKPGLGPRDGRASFQGDRFDSEAHTVGDLLDMLNGYQLFRVTGGPAWMRTDRYDIHAKSEAKLAPEVRKEAIMVLLEERFHLTTHSETREIPTLILTAPEMPGGLKPAKESETYSITSNDRHDPTFVAVPMAGLVNYLSQMFGSPVKDETGLKGGYDFSLQVSAIEIQPGGLWGDRVREAVSAFGFKLESKKVPTEVTVVDRCERPTEN